MMIRALSFLLVTSDGSKDKTNSPEKDDDCRAVYTSSALTLIHDNRKNGLKSMVEAMQLIIP